MHYYNPQETKTHKHQLHLKLLSYPNDKRLCIIEYLQEYIKHTKALRKEQSQLLISFNKPHHAVSKDTIGLWVKNMLKQSGIDTGQFTCHSTRSASTSCAKAAGLNLEQRMQSAGWSTSTAFAKFYHKNIETDINFGSAILNNVNDAQ